MAITSMQFWMPRLALLACALIMQACATSKPLNTARELFRHGSTQQALQTLAEDDVSSRDKLLLYLDRGTIAQAGGDYDASIRAFGQALELIDELDYVSVRDQSAALLSNDWATRYKGEYSERLWIHTFQMLNYLMLNLPQSAAVEARRAAALYEEYDDVLKQDYFSRLVMAMSFLAAGQVDSANVEYRKLQKDFDLAPPKKLSKNQGELVLFIETGFIEPKLPGSLPININARISFPYYANTASRPPVVQVFEGGKSLSMTRADTELVSIASKALAKRGTSIAVRQAARVAAKYNIAESLERKDALAGNIAKMFFFLIEQADTRSWETLPAYLTLVRIPLPAGPHTLNLRINSSGDYAQRVTQQRELKFDLASGQRYFKLIRLEASPR